MELGATQPRAECHSVTQEPVAEPDSSLLACAQQSPSTDARWWCRGAQRSLQVLSRHPGGPPALRALRPPVGLRKAFLQGQAMALVVKNPPARAGDAGDAGAVPESGRSPEAGSLATQSDILAWRTPWTEGPGKLQSMGSHRVRHD